MEIEIVENSLWIDASTVERNCVCAVCKTEFSVFFCVAPRLCIKTVSEQGGGILMCVDKRDCKSTFGFASRIDSVAFEQTEPGLSMLAAAIGKTRRSPADTQNAFVLRQVGGCRSTACL